MNVYPWKRFWCPRDSGYSLADSGYLYDPDSEFGGRLNSSLAPLADFADFPCLVALGEPGIGKSTEFASEFVRVEREAATQGNVALLFDLKEYQTDSRLVSDVFENDAIRQWRSGRHVLHLFFDSLDEGQLEVRNIAAMLAGQLQRIGPDAKRLRLRIACRTAEWPASLEEAFIGIWNEDAVAAIELAPLRRCDVVLAAQAEGIPAEEFLHEVAQKDVQPFAINPITLRFLLDEYRRSGKLPATKQDLYEAGCRRLCDESSQSRRDAGHYGTLSPEQRLEIASRIAALSVLCGRATIDIGASALPDADRLTVADLAGGAEQIQTDRFDVTDSAVREVLRTTLFSGRGPQRLGFAHRTYAEFLAARYLTRRELDQTQIGSLVFHPEWETKVVPQLAETAAWIAVAEREIFDRMMAGDPQSLLRSDVATADDRTRAALMARLLHGFQTGELDDADWSLRDRYGKLAHSGLAEQLEPCIRDRSQNVATRRFAADVAEACGETGLLDALADVALDSADAPHMRAQAAYAIVGIGDATACERLKPLAFGQAGPDLDDELRGAALQGIWPRGLITAEELFGSLTRPQRESLLGAYRNFLNHTLAKHLTADDLVVGLQWCSKQSLRRGEIDHFEDVASDVVRLSVSCLDKPDVFDALAEYVAARIRQHVESESDKELFDSLAASARRKIIAAVVSKLDDPKQYRFGLIFGYPALIHGDDLEWLLERSATAESSDAKRIWAELARLRFQYGGQPSLDLVLKSCESNAVAAVAFADLIGSVELNSATAIEMRARHNHELELERRSQMHWEPPVLAPPPKVRVEERLKRFEAGDLNAWWRLNRELQLKADDQVYQHDFEADLTKLPGWGSADEATKRRILVAAQHYLLEWRTTPRSWLGTNIFNWRDLSGYRALTLVFQCDAQFIELLSPERWTNWAPVILRFPIVSISDIDQAEELRTRLVAIAYENAPEAVISALNALIDYENQDQSSGRLFVLDRVRKCADRRMADALLRKARDRSLRPKSVGDLVENLMGREPAAAEALARAMVIRGRYGANSPATALCCIGEESPHDAASSSRPHARSRRIPSSVRSGRRNRPARRSSN